jgi:hypothetical protein
LCTAFHFAVALASITRNAEPTNHSQKAISKMKTIMRTVLYLPMTAMLLTATFAGDALAKKPLPFHGYVEAVETFEFDPDSPRMYVDGSGSGVATRLGRFTVTYEHTVDLLTGNGVGSYEYTAANGDTLLTECTANGQATEIPNISVVVEWHTITGGTGRFADASGSFTVKRLVSLITGETAGLFSGTIDLDKGKVK